MSAETEARSLFDPGILRPALLESLRKVDPPRPRSANPVMFVVEIGALITTVAWLIQGLRGAARSAAATSPPGSPSASPPGSGSPSSFANLAEALAEGPRPGPGGEPAGDAGPRPRHGCATGGEKSAAELSRGDVVVVEGGGDDPRRRHRDRGDRLGRRVGDNGGVGAG